MTQTRSLAFFRSAILALFIGASLQFPLRAQSCTQTCSNAYTSCQNKVNGQFNSCEAKAETTYQACMAAAQTALTECLQNVAEQLQPCLTNCQNNPGCEDGCNAE